ncbi:hypothetical protein PINS_up001755 [Pythium insidiosum]|nr:hypothetical protein PINS_up001755 [Pythium insidiosum]
MVVERVAIPADLPLGSVIGKKGSRQKALKEVHCVKTQVDTERREVVLRGSATNVKNSERDLLALFHMLSIDSKRVRRWAVQDGAQKSWRFSLSPTLFDEFGDYPYVWQGKDVASDSSTENEKEQTTSAPQESWVSEFNDNFVDRMVKDLDIMAVDSSSLTKVKIAIGFQTFCVRHTYDSPAQTLSWPALQALSITHDVIPKWRGVLPAQSLTAQALLRKLESMVTAPWEAVISAYVKEEATGRYYFIKYRLEDGQLKPGRRGNRHVLGTYDVLLNNRSEFRARVVSRTCHAGEHVSCYQQLPLRAASARRRRVPHESVGRSLQATALRGRRLLGQAQDARRVAGPAVHAGAHERGRQ